MYNGYYPFKHLTEEARDNELRASFLIFFRAVMNVYVEACSCDGKPYSIRIPPNFNLTFLFLPLQFHIAE